MNAEEIRELPSLAYLDWQNFLTFRDNHSEGLANYLRGYNLGSNALRVFIDSEGAWFVESEKGQEHEHEIIGVAPNSGFFWKGVLDSPASIIVCKDCGPEIIR